MKDKLSNGLTGIAVIPSKTLTKIVKEFHCRWLEIPGKKGNPKLLEVGTLIANFILE